MTEELVNWLGAAEILKVKPPTIRRWTYERRIPFVRIGRAVRFRRSDLERMVRAGLVPALRPLRPAPDPGEGDVGER